jgi:hypothetical protein
MHFEMGSSAERSCIVGIDGSAAGRMEGDAMVYLTAWRKWL